MLKVVAAGYARLHASMPMQANVDIHAWFEELKASTLTRRPALLRALRRLVLRICFLLRRVAISILSEPALFITSVHACASSLAGTRCTRSVHVARFQGHVLDGSYISL